MMTTVLKIDHRGDGDITTTIITATDLMPPDVKMQVLVQFECEPTDVIFSSIVDQLEESGRGLRAFIARTPPTVTQGH
jgi:hypothetical protein